MSQTEYTEIIGLLSNNTKHIVSQTIIYQGINIHINDGNGGYFWLQSIANWVNNSCWEYDETEKLWFLNDGCDNIIQVSKTLSIDNYITKDESQIKTIVLETPKGPETFFLMYC